MARAIPTARAAAFGQNRNLALPVPASCGRSRLRCVQVHSYSSKFQDPYSILGVPETSNELEVKRAYRKLAKQYHPDVAKESTEAAHLHFLNIAEAYEFLLQLMRAQREETGVYGQRPGNSEAWHDWYWNFRMSRTYERQKMRSEGDTGAAQCAAQPQDTEGLRSQLAGLRHRAAIRRNRPAPAAAAMGADVTSDCDNAAEHSFIVAEGPADSSEPSPLPQPSQPSQPVAVIQSDMTLFGSSQQPSEASEQPEQATVSGHPPRRKFTATTDTRDALKSQLHGMRRKAAIRQRYQHSSPAA